LRYNSTGILTAWALIRSAVISG